MTLFRKGSLKEKFLVLAFLVILSSILGCVERDSCFLLRVESLDSGRVLLNLPVRPGDQIYLDWIHSSAKTPILDTFQVSNNGEIILVEEDYQWYGAGLEFMDHEEVCVVPKAKDTRTVLKRHFPYLLLRVGWVSKQRLTLNTRTIPLLDIANGGELLKIWIVEMDKQ